MRNTFLSESAANTMTLTEKTPHNFAFAQQSTSSILDDEPNFMTQSHQNWKKPDVLDKLKRTIELMNKYHQIEVLKILSKNLCKLNENKSGVYVNMSFLNEDTLNEINEYIEYTQEQENNIVSMEYQKEEFKNTFFVEKEDKDNMTVSYNSLAK